MMKLILIRFLAKPRYNAEAIKKIKICVCGDVHYIISYFFKKFAKNIDTLAHTVNCISCLFFLSFSVARTFVENYV
jgi:hypothetical protein